jgi:hypothetical protein
MRSIGAWDPLGKAIDAEFSPRGDCARARRELEMEIDAFARAASRTLYVD